MSIKQIITKKGANYRQVELHNHKVNAAEQANRTGEKPLNIGFIFS